MQKGIWLIKNKIKNIYPYLSDNIECDVVIVGGGICGAITAYFLAKDGFKIAVLEKNIEKSKIQFCVSVLRLNKSNCI